MESETKRYQQRSLFQEHPNLVSTKKEDQWFDRKSFRIAASALADTMVAFANADGGTIVVGVENDGRITGTDHNVSHLNELQQAAIEFTEPPVRQALELEPCIRSDGVRDQILIIEVPPGDRVHRKKSGEVFQRFGDQNRRLGPEATQELLYDKGERTFDAVAAVDATVSDLDQDALFVFAEKVGTPGDAVRALRVRHLFPDHHDERVVSWGAVLLFGHDAEAFLPQAHVRILRYEGREAGTGSRLNLVFDRRISGSLPRQIEQAQEIMLNQLRQVTRLDENGRFTTVSELPRFAWLEAIVNAVTHRSYSLQGDHIRVKIFDDRVEVESPGRLPGPVRIDNIRHTRFSRNPRISRALSDLGLVQELNEGVNRMYDEMVAVGLPEPRLTQTDAGFKVTLTKQRDARTVIASISALVPAMTPAIEAIAARQRVSTKQAASLAGTSVPTARRHLRELERQGLIKLVARSKQDPTSHWVLTLSLHSPSPPTAT